MGALRTPLLICLILAIALCVLSEAKERSKKEGKPREVKKPSKGNVARKAASKHQAIIHSVKKPQRTIPSVLATTKQLKETKEKKSSKGEQSKPSKKIKKGGHSKEKHSTERKEHKHAENSKTKPSRGNDARKTASKLQSVLHEAKKPQRVTPSLLASTAKQLKPKEKTFQKRNILSQVKNTKKGAFPRRSTQEKGEKTRKQTSQIGGHSKMKDSRERREHKHMKHSKVKHHSKESKNDSKNRHQHSKESKEHKGKHHHRHSKKSMEHKEKGHSKGKHHHHSKESKEHKEKGHSKEKHHHSKESKENKEKGHSKGKHHHHSKESKEHKEKGHSKGKQHHSKESKEHKEKGNSNGKQHHSKESKEHKEKAHSKEKHHHSKESKEHKEKGHSKEKHHHSKENKKNRVSREKRNSNERIPKQEDNIHRELLCEWKMKTIKCDAGETIKIMSAMYGRKSRSVCPHAAMSNLKCEAKSSMGKVSQACDGKDKCVLSASNSVFGDPCGGTFKYLDVKYACINTGVRYVSIKTEKQGKMPYTYTLLDKYGYIIGDTTSIELTVQACNDAHIALMGQSGENGKLYEIVIGGWGNSKSVIRTQKQGQNLYTKNGRRLDCRQYRKFKISWTGGLITVQSYVNGVLLEFLRYKDPSPMDIQSVGVSTGIWATGEWRIDIKDDDKCNGRECHANAMCTRGGCVCKRGYYGDGYNSCEKSCLCMASGDPHYRTFDGQMIHFMGTCRYTLTRSLDRGGKCAFNVEVKNERRGQNTRVAFTRYVDVEVYGRKIRLHQNKKVFIDNERRYLPVKELKGQLTVTFSGRYVQIWTECGLLVNFDGNHAVSVVVPKSFSRNMTGLCGDCDGKMNDFRTRDGNDVTKKSSRYNIIGNSYKVLEHGTASNSRCVPVAQDSPKCDSSLANRLNRREYCGEITEKTGRFAKCISRFPVQAKSFFDSCVFDLCSFQGEPNMMSKVRCNSVEAFAEECEENGIIVNWRSKEFCPLTCEDPNMVYKADASGCPSTCVDPEAPSSCTLEPREGCVCKDGFALSDDKCIPLSQCGCVDSDGAYFPLKTRKSSQDCGTDYVCQRRGLNSRLVPIRSGRKCHRKAQCTLDKSGERKCVCNQGYEGDGYSNCKPLCGMKFKCHPQARCRNGRCKCNRGLSGDGVRECQEMCTCGASGDPHYRTYDGQMIHFMGICKYILTQTTRETDPCKISVQVSNERRGRNRRVSFTKSVHVQVYGKKIVMKEDKHVFIDGEQKYLPVREENGNLTIFISGKNVRLVTACGHRVYWDGRSVARVSVPKSYTGKLTGLCGDCNGRKDDFRTKNGLDVSKKKNRYSIIGNSYMKGRQYAEDTENCVTVEDDVRCSNHMTESASKGDHCGYINPSFNKVSPFQSCVKENTAMATDLFNACKFDVCAYFDDPTTRRDVVCRSLEALEAECETRGFNVKWRSSNLCPMTCPKNMRYSSAVSGCPSTCLTPESEQACVLDDTEGCECLPGFLLSGTDCVPVEQCGCLTPRGDYLPLGTRYVSDDCTTVTKCTNENGEAILERVTISERCHKDGMCGVVDGYHQCKCKDGYHGDGINSCLPMCGGRFKCHVDAECQNGKCVCKAGKYGDGTNKCYDACVCSASGDPHYHLFDGQTIHFMGNCKYLLSKLTDNKTCGFDVQVENEHRLNQKHVSFTRLVNIKIGQQSITLLQGRRLQIDDVLTFTPYEDPKGRFVVVIKGKYITLIGRCGLVVMFDGNHVVSVIVPRELGKTLTGICGNCNGKADDFKTKNGRDVSKNPNKFVYIGNSYEVTDVTDGAKKGCKSDDYKVSCSKTWESRIKSDELCGKLLDKKGVFGKCVKKEPKYAQSFFASCRIDLCAAEGDEILATKLLCQSLEAFADNCQMDGVTNKHWRTTNLCPLKCSSSEVYNPAIVARPRTCDDPDASASYSLAPVEGCMCKEGYVLSGIKCVRQRDCGCFYNREYFPVNGTGPLTNCEQEQTCVHKDGLNSMETVERKLSCRRNAECRNVDGMYKCQCRVGFKGNNNTGCKEIKVKNPTSPKPSAKPTPESTNKPTQPQTAKPTPEPTTRPRRPKYVPYSECKISMKHQSCGSSLTLSGACQYRSQFSDQCQYSVLMLKLGNKIFAKVQINRRVRILKHGKKFSDCASFLMVNSTVTITDNVCEKCTLEFIRNLTPRRACKAP
ncbi:zonadhesin-like isoform X2 [Mizuhopecten yessoensis]|uniref:zonadhesin-like isoform X2 n=1 Tax=Mizuhopecten yessoensis TaxID=6573 RepID=UPI000B458C6D|nr:zonadhesin-like isoform X2 [Mizuhopecten yessoensis]